MCQIEDSRVFTVMYMWDRAVVHVVEPQHFVDLDEKRLPEAFYPRSGLCSALGMRLHADAIYRCACMRTPSIGSISTHPS